MNYDFFEAIFTTTWGLVMAVFHNYMGESTAKFQAKYMGYTYNKDGKKITKIGFLLMGIFFAFVGILELLK